jgi:hypothetical protein
MSYRVKWVSIEEYVRIIKEHERNTVYPSGMTAWDLAKGKEYSLMTFDFNTNEMVLIKLAQSELIKQLL